MVPVLNVVLPVFLIIVIGFVIGKHRKINVQPFINLIIYITGPALIFSSIVPSDINLNDFGIISASAIGIIAILGVITFIIFKITKTKKVGLYLPITIGNTGYLGYPVALFAFGVAGLSRAVVYDMVNSLVLFSIGIYIIHKKNDWKEIFKIPLIYAVLLGLAFNLFKIPVNEIIFKPIETIGMITIPLALLVLGYQLTQIKITSAKTAILASIFRIVGGFLAALLIIKVFDISGLVKNIILLEAAMPSAVMTMILTAKYKRDSSLVASIVLITTVLGILTIPLILLFISA